ncbi:porin [Massilia sp. CFBP9012]|uniref:porin n=1 Tax=Massilia sp. CFBP9012 TaxID=3096531 RepID=UPI002A6AC1AB|nr:porin [Massilia sp. CFBP9012]MDY0973800.1 porin [Massilia sp. CFBP9012]
MNILLAPLALLSAFIGSAYAQSSVQFYGNIDIGLIKRSGQPLALGKRANNTLGIKGSEALGNGLDALFQLEIRYEPDTGSAEQGPGGAQRPLFQGQSRVGLRGAFGTVRLGRGLTAFQESSAAFDPWYGSPTPAGFQTDLTIAGFTSDPLGPVGNSTNRMSNGLFYNSPEVAGMQLNATVGTREANGGAPLIGKGSAQDPQYPANAAPSSTPVSLTATYRRKDLSLMLAFERNAVESRLYSAGVSLVPTPSTRVMVSHTRQDQSHTRVVQAHSKAWVIGLQQVLGPGRVLAGYGWKDVDESSTARQASLGYEYDLSKRTRLYADVSSKKAPQRVRHLDLGVNHQF